MKNLPNYSLHEYLNPPEININHSNLIKLGNKWRSNGVASPFTRLYFIKSGEGRLKENNTEWQLKPNRIYIIPAGTYFEYCCDSTLEKLYFHITMIGNDGRELLCNLTGIKSAPCSRAVIDRIIFLYSNKSFLNSLQLRHEISGILLSLIMQYPQESIVPKQYSSLLSLAMDKIQQNLSMQLRIKDIANELYIAESTLRKKFKEEVGISMSKYIDELIFFKAELLLSKDDMSIKEISDMLGFSDQFYFSNKFSKILGKSPQEYRKKMREHML